MSVYLGVDFHARTQTVCWCDQADGVLHQRTLDHQQDDVRGFYTQFAAPAIVGLEATGYARWFHRLLETLGHQLFVGDAYVIRKCALRRQKNDRRDAELLLDLLLHGDFPSIHIPPIASQAVLRLLRYRQRLVEIQTKLRNGVQALALNHQLRLGPKLWNARGQEQLLALIAIRKRHKQRSQCQTVRFNNQTNTGCASTLSTPSHNSAQNTLLTPASAS